MQKRENPYTPGAGRKPPNLAGRDRDLESFQALIERLAAGGYERSLIYSGLRGVGKTVLLMELDVLATEAGWATTDVQEVGSQPDFRVTFARMAARLLREMSRRHRIKDRVERALGVVKAFSIAVPAGVQLKLDCRPPPGSPTRATLSRTSPTWCARSARSLGSPVPARCSYSMRCTTSTPLRWRRSASPSRRSAATRSRWRWSARAYPTCRCG